MSYALRLQNTQKVRLDKELETVIFQTKTLTGCVYYFPLTLNQFLALDDILAYISVHSTATGHYPLGQSIWLQYYYHGAILYDNMKDGRPYFRFDDFHLYKNRLHRKLLSFLRHDNSDAGGERGVKIRNQVAATRKRHILSEEDGTDASEASHRKRPLSIVLQPKTASEKTECVTQKCNTLFSSSNNADLPPSGQACSVFSKRNGAGTRRRSDSDIASSHTSLSASSPDILCTEQWPSLGAMECD